MKERADSLKTSIVIPAYNEGETISAVVEAARKAIGADGEILVIDDGSTDDTAGLARAAGARVIRHPYNIGNGASVKTGIREARGEVLILLDGDGQHRPDDIPRFLEKIGDYDMVIGARAWRSHASFLRWGANTLFNLFARYLTGMKIADMTSGYRAVRRDLARKFVYLLPNRFSYPTTITLALIKSGHSVAFIPIDTGPRGGKSKLRPWKEGIRFVVIMLRIATLYSPFRVFFPVSVFFFLVGMGYYLYTYVTQHRFTNMSALLLVNAVVVFLIGLVSEQISQVRLERIEED